MLQGIKKISVFVMALLTLYSCGEKGVVVNQSKVLSQQKWEESKALEFEFDIKDTVNYYNFSVLIRNTENYQWSNVFLFSDITFPNGKTRRDTLEIVLADQYGNWLGNNSGTIITTTSTFMEHRRFPLEGKYKVALAHGMRVPVLEEITDVGIKLKQWQE